MKRSASDLGSWMGFLDTLSASRSSGIGFRKKTVRMGDDKKAMSVYIGRLTKTDKGVRLNQDELLGSA
jgi:hypothetical protein